MEIKPENAADHSDSIVKKAILLLLLVAPAYLFNFAFLVFSQRILGTKDFGVFYTGLTMINILSGPAIILNLFYSKRITENLSLFGSNAAVSEFKDYVRHIMIWGSLVACPVTVLMCLTGFYFGVESITLVIVICLTSYCIYLTETTRAAYQGLKKFIALGIQTLAWMAVRFSLGILGLLSIGYVWAGITGVLLSALTIFLAGYYYLTSGSGKMDRRRRNLPFELRKMIYFCLSYGFFILLMYIDVIAGYLVFKRSDLGIYSGACVIGKSMILITNPIVQVYFPVVVEQQVKAGVNTKTLAKTIGLSLAICCSVLVVVAAYPDFVGAKILGSQDMNAGLLIAVTASGVPLILLRVFILLQLSRGYDKHGFILLPFCVVQFLLLILFSNDIVQFARLFTISSFAITVLYGLMCKPKLKIKDLDKRAFGIGQHQV